MYKIYKFVNGIWVSLFFAMGFYCITTFKLFNNQLDNIHVFVILAVLSSFELGVRLALNFKDNKYFKYIFGE